MTLLKKCEVAARPISFETIDVVLQNALADKIVKELTGKSVDEQYRQMMIVQLENYLFSLEDLAEHWKLVSSSKY